MSRDDSQSIRRVVHQADSTYKTDKDSLDPKKRAAAQAAKDKADRARARLSRPHERAELPAAPAKPAKKKLSLKLPEPGSGNPEGAKAWQEKYGNAQSAVTHQKAGLTPLGKELAGKAKKIGRAITNTDPVDKVRGIKKLELKHKRLHKFEKQELQAMPKFEKHERKLKSISRQITRNSPAANPRPGTKKK